MKCPSCGEKITVKQNICKNCKLHLKGSLGPDGGIPGEDFAEVDILFIIKYFLGNAFKFLALIVLVVLGAYLLVKKFTAS